MTETGGRRWAALFVAIFFGIAACAQAQARTYDLALRDVPVSVA